MNFNEKNMADRISHDEMLKIQETMLRNDIEYFPLIIAKSRIRSYWIKNSNESNSSILSEDIKYSKQTGETLYPEFPDELIYSEIKPNSLQVMENKIEFGWLIGFSPEFLKSIKKIDKNLKGRILDAIDEISTNPLKLKGDTIKPLRLDGLWRYRVGDFRLIYKPDSKNKRVILYTFSSRGSAFQ